MSFGAATNVFVSNVGQPDSSGRGATPATAQKVTQGQVLGQKATAAPETPEEPTQKQNRIQEMINHLGTEALQTLDAPPDAETFRGTVVSAADTPNLPAQQRFQLHRT